MCDHDRDYHSENKEIDEFVSFYMAEELEEYASLSTDEVAHELIFNSSRGVWQICQAVSIDDNCNFHIVQEHKDISSLSDWWDQNKGSGL